MTDPRYHASVTDPDETSPISAERLAELRDGPGDRGGSDRADRSDRGSEHSSERADHSSPRGADRGAAPRDLSGGFGSATPGTGSAGASDHGAAAGRGATPAGSSGWYDQQRYSTRSSEPPRSGSNGQNGYPPSSYPTSGASAGGPSSVAGSPISGSPVAGRSLGTPPPAGTSRSARPSGPPTTGATPAAGPADLRSGPSDPRSGAPDLRGGSDPRGASDLRGASDRGGASDLRGGPSDLRGGASDLRGSPSDLRGGAADPRGGAADPRGGAPDLRGGRPGQPESSFGSLGVGSYGSATGYASGATPAAGPAGAGPATSSLYGGSGYSSSGYGNEATTYTGSTYGGGYGPASAYPTTAGRELDATGAGLTVGGAAGAVSTGPFVGGATLGTSPSRRPARAPRGGAGARPARRARLMVKQVDPWSTFKFSLVLAVAMFFVWLVAVGVLYGVMDGIGVFDKINNLYGELSGSNGQRLITPGLVLGLAALIGAVNIVLTTALATVGAFVYNICSDLVGGIEVTLAERD
jgi:hypothetical protein